MEWGLAGHVRRLLIAKVTDQVGNSQSRDSYARAQCTVLFEIGE